MMFWVLAPRRHVIEQAFRRNILSLSATLKMETLCSSETLVSTEESTQCQNPEHRHHRRENPKSQQRKSSLQDEQATGVSDSISTWQRLQAATDP
jgi:hypothetical protein